MAFTLRLLFKPLRVVHLFFPSLFRFGLLLLGSDSLSRQADERFGAALAADDVGVRRVWESHADGEVV